MGMNKHNQELKDRKKQARQKALLENKSAQAEATGAVTEPVATGTVDISAKREEQEGKEESKNGKKKGKARKVLRKAVKKAVKGSSEKIADSLVNKAIDGDKFSTETMLSLIEKKKKAGGGSSRHGGLTAADLLGSEDEWESETEEAMEGQSEVGMGGREPEGEEARSSGQ